MTWLLAHPSQCALIGTLLCTYFVLGNLLAVEDPSSLFVELLTRFLPIIAMVITAALALTGFVNLIIANF